MKSDRKVPMRNHPTRASQVWAIDHAILSSAHRIYIRMVIDVGTRLPLSATLTFGIEEIGSGLERLIERSRIPEQIWLDNSFVSRSDRLLKLWTKRHRISINYSYSPEMKAISERSFRALLAFLRGKRPPTILELAKELERWRETYVQDNLVKQ